MKDRGGFSRHDEREVQDAWPVLDGRRMRARLETLEIELTAGANRRLAGPFADFDGKLAYAGTMVAPCSSTSTRPTARCSALTGNSATAPPRAGGASVRDWRRIVIASGTSSSAMLSGLP